MRKQRIFNIALFIAYTAWCLVLYSYHEPWRDEVQSWLLARDLDFPTLLSQLRYDGHPVGWFLFLWPLAQLGLPFAAQRILHLIIVLAAGGIICFKAPSPFLKLFLLFATPMMYELPALSRNYAMSALALLIMMICHKERFGRYCAVYCIALFFLINSNAYGTIAGIALLGGEVLLLLIRRFFPGRIDSENPPAKPVAAYITVSAASVICVWLVSFSNLLLPLNPVPLYEEAHFSIIQNYGFDLSRLKEAFLRLGIVAVLGDTPGGLKAMLSSFEINWSGVADTALTAGTTIIIVISITGAALFAKKRVTRIQIIAVGFAAYLGNLAVVAVLSIFNVRHGVPFIFLMVYLWWTALNERREAGAEVTVRPVVRRLAVIAAAIVFAGALFVNLYRARRDILYPYSMGEATAAFLSDNGYDSGDTLVLATDHAQVSTVLGFTQEIKAFRFVYGDCSFAVWQVHKSAYERSFDLESFIDTQLEEHGDEYRSILFIGQRREYPFTNKYPVIYDSGSGAIMGDECYFVMKIK